MSRRMVRPGVWIEEGPSGVASPPRWGGGLVVGGPATGPSPVLPPQRSADATARKREWNLSRPKKARR